MSNLLSLCKTAELYVSNREGNDATGDGTREKPFKTGLKVMSLLVRKMTFHLLMTSISDYVACQ